VQTATDGFLSKPQGKSFDFPLAALDVLDALRQHGTLTQLSIKYFGRDIIAKGCAQGTH